MLQWGHIKGSNRYFTFTEEGIAYLKDQYVHAACGQHSNRPAPKPDQIVSEDVKRFLIKKGKWETCMKNNYVKGSVQHFKYTDEGIAFLKRENMYNNLHNPEPDQVITSGSRAYLERKTVWDKCVVNDYVEMGIDLVNSPVAANLPDGAETEDSGIKMPLLGRQFVLPGCDAKLARTEDIASKIKKQCQRKIVVDEKRMEREHIEEKKKVEGETRNYRLRTRQLVIENFERSPRCWNVYGAGHNGKLGGCDGVEGCCKFCFEYNAHAFEAAEVDLENLRIASFLRSHGGRGAED